MKKELVVEKLSDDALEEVSGGAWTIAWALPSAAACTALTAIPAVCCSVASKKRKKEAKKALQRGDVEEYKELQKEAASLRSASRCLTGLSVIPGTVTVVAACAGLRLM